MEQRNTGHVLVIAAIALVGCRIEPAVPFWVETQGHGPQISAIAASPRGVEGVGQSNKVYRYPGEYGVPWKTIYEGAGKRVGCSPKATYVLERDGAISVVRPGGKPRRWDHSAPWRSTFVTADENDVVYVVSAGRASRVDGEKLVPIACAGPAVAIAATTKSVYVVSPDGDLDVAEGETCRRFDAPGGVASVTAFETRLAIVASGGAYQWVQGQWRALPVPVRYRDDGTKAMRITEVAGSRNSLWARDGDGDVFVLWEPS
jgi:hypothetical protein